MSEFEKAASDFRVGVVTFLAILLTVAGVTFAGGDKGLLFRKTETVKAFLYDVGGLKKGSSVTLGGMVIGKVTEIRFREDTQQALIEVNLQIRSEIRPKIKSDAIPSVRTQGMLGDRYIEISLGSKEAPTLEEGKPLTGKATADFDEALNEARATLIETTKMLSAINQKKGTVGQFIYDPDFYEKLTMATLHLSELIEDFKKNPKRYIDLSVF